MLDLSFIRSAFGALILVFAGAPLGVAAAPIDDAKATVQRFVDGMNAGDFKALSLCAPSATVVDDIPPYVWSGAGACGRWVNDVIANMRDLGTTTITATFDKATTADIHDKTAYLVFPAKFAMTIKGAQVTKTGVITFIMDQGGDGWKFTHFIWGRTTQTP